MHHYFMGARRIPFTYWSYFSHRVVNPFHAVDQVGERCDGQYWI